MKYVKALLQIFRKRKRLVNRFLFVKFFVLSPKREFTFIFKNINKKLAFNILNLTD